MKHTQFIICLCILFTAISSALRSQARQVVIQQFTLTQNGVTDTVDFMPLTIDPSGNVTIATNQKLSPTQYDANTSKQLANGVNSWVNSFSSPTNQKAFITASCTDNLGNTFVAGGVRTSAANGLDMFVIGYQANGTQFMSAFYNGPQSSNDVASGVCVSNTGKVIITGGSDGTLPGIMDYATIAFNVATGAPLWAMRYDYSNFMDVPTGITYDASGAVYVTGASGASLTDYKIATVKYRLSDGLQLDVKRNNNAGAGFNKPFGITTDAAGNVYIAGTAYNAATGSYDAHIQKLDTSLSTLWEHSYDGYGWDDAATGIALDSWGNVVVTGSSTRANGSTGVFVLKYNNAGTSKTRYVSHSQTTGSAGMKVRINSNDDIFIGGQYGSGSSQDVFVLILDTACRPLGEKIFNGPSGQRDKFMDMVIGTDKIYLSVRSQSAAVDANLVVTYMYKDFTSNAVVDPVKNVQYVNSNVLLTFKKAALKMGAINNTSLTYGVLSNFVADSTCDKLTAALIHFDKKLNAKNFTCRKIHPYLTDADSVSETRLGTYIPIPEFFAELSVTLPPTVSTLYAADALKNIWPDLIASQLNYVYTPLWIPNDPEYAQNQSCLHPTAAYPYAHINCEPAWDRTKGQPFVRVGVYDSGFINGLGDGDTAGDTCYLSSNDTYDYIGHGTKCAAVIGAKSNNAIGIAGIAGGDGTAPGVSLVNMKIYDQAWATTHTIKQAFVDGANGLNVPHGRALHIINCSWGSVNVAYDSSLVNGINYVNANGVAFIAARGNYEPASVYSISAFSSPATLKPHVIMNVGASGTDGEYHKNGANGNNFTSMNEKDVDFVAPGAHATIRAPYFDDGGNPAGAPFAPPASPLSVTYTTFGGTSSAAAHASGVTALMMSYRNQSVPAWNNLVHEDCEAILKRTATDLTSPSYTETFGSDDNTGYGRINADSALHALEPQYKIRHIDTWHNNVGVSTVTTAVHPHVQLAWNNYYYGPAGGLYNVDVIEVETTYALNFGSETFIDAWPLYAVSNGYKDSYGNYNTIQTDEPRYAELVNASATSATVRSFVYRFNFSSGAPGYPLTNVYMPIVPNGVNNGLTLYTLGTTVTGIGNPQPQVDYFNVYPNPSNGSFTMGFNSKTDAKGLVTVTDIMGKTVYQKQEALRTGVNRYALHLADLPQGIYFLSLEVENNKSMVKKLIIN